MHEMSIAQSIINIVDEYMSEEDGRKLIEVAVEVGELVAVVPESLTFCYEALVDSTPYQGSKLLINVLPLQARCSHCDHTFRIEKFNFICPNCKSNQISVLSGQELRISHLEVT